MILFAIWEAFWRRMFGSDGWNIPIIKNRAIQHGMNCGVVVFVLFLLQYSFWQIILATAVFEGCYWSWGHGAAFDIGHGGQPDEKTINRYKERFWNKWCEKLLPESLWYTRKYDALWMFFRYEIPAVVVSLLLLNAWFLLAGFTTTAVYWICWWLYDIGKLKSPTDKAEWIVGFTTGLFLC